MRAKTLAPGAALLALSNLVAMAPLRAEVLITAREAKLPDYPANEPMFSGPTSAQSQSQVVGTDAPLQDAVFQKLALVRDLRHRRRDFLS